MVPSPTFAAGVIPHKLNSLLSEKVEVEAKEMCDNYYDYILSKEICDTSGVEALLSTMPDVPF